MVRGRARQLPLEKENEHGGHERKPDVGWRIELGESEPGADRDEQRLVRGHGAERGFDGRDGERRDRIVWRDGRYGIERKLGSERGGNGRRDGTCGAAGQLVG